MTQRIVVIEDESSTQQMLRDLLEGAGFSVLALDHPNKVTTLDPRTPPHLFLIDLSLPGMTGLEMAQELKNCGFAETPMIALSASCLFRKVAERSQVFVRTLPKPFDIQELLTTIAEQVGRVRVWERPPGQVISSSPDAQPIRSRGAGDGARGSSAWSGRFLFAAPP